MPVLIVSHLIWAYRKIKGVLDLLLSISMAYNVISCQKFAKDTKILTIADFAI